MNVLDFNYPEVTQADMAFPTFSTIPELLTEAKERGYYNGRTKGNDKFSEIFYSGGSFKPKKFESDETAEKAKKAFMYTRSLMGSWSPKHEEKEAVCAMIWEEVLDLD